MSWRTMQSMPVLNDLIRRGLAAHHAGRVDTARELYQQALLLDSGNPHALHLLGTALLQLGQPGQAVEFLQRAAPKMRGHPGVHGNLAEACLALGQYEQARDAFRKASRLDPANVHYRIGIATALAMQGRLSEAETFLRKQAREFANEALVWLNLGNVLRDLGRPAEALDCFVKTLALDPQRVDARNNLGGVLYVLRRFEEAEHEFRACIAAAPDSLSPPCNLASLLIDVGRFGEAEALLRRVIERAPDLVEAHSWLGAALSHQGRLREALPCYKVAAELAPQSVSSALAYAEVLMENSKIGAGLRWYAHALSMNRSAQMKDSLGDALLAAGLFAEGWADYASRPAREQQPDLPLAEELPPKLDGTHVCLVREQGLGDEIFFLRFARALQARGARITYRASNKLRSLLARAHFLNDVLEENAPLPASDATLLIGDLPHALCALPATALPAVSRWDEAAPVPDFAQQIVVFWPELLPSIELEPLAERITEMRDRLARAGPPPYLGITWRAGTLPHLQKGEDWVLHKTIAPAQLAEAVRDFRGTLIALQRRPDPVELDALSAALARPVHDFTAVNEDLEGMLALLALIEEYVGVSNTNMHLRAGVGKTARVLVPCPAEWRWMASGGESPWFPGFPIYRQGLDGDWKAALARLAKDLKHCQT